jgi:hypothetical protein
MESRLLCSPLAVSAAAAAMQAARLASKPAAAAFVRVTSSCNIEPQCSLGREAPMNAMNSATE